MTKINLAYGKTGMKIELEDWLNVTIVEPIYIPGLVEPEQALRQALRMPIGCPPLREFVETNETVAIIFCDITRPTPNHLILPAVLNELAHIVPEQITLFNACGTHRKNTEAELRGMLGDQIFDSYRIVQNDAFDPHTLTCIGKSGGGREIWVNEEMASCDLKILTGFIEPHFFSGFSGGGKAIMPGMGGIQSILGNHNAANIGHLKATWGLTNGNPIWEEIHESSRLAGRQFLVNVTLNKEKEITGVFAGDLTKAHHSGCEFARSTAMVPIDHLFDIVVTTNSGYPLDLNLYQAVKGMSAAAQIVRPGGSIIVAAECWDGIPTHGLYGHLLKDSSSPKELLAKITTPGFLKPDQWQAQIQAIIQSKARVYVYSHNLTDDQIINALLQPCRDIPGLIKQLYKEYGSHSCICILPEGPQTIPYLVDSIVH